jgi:hypothetical protein
MRWRGKALLAAALVVASVMAGALLRNAELDAGGVALKTEDYPTALKKLRPLAYLGDSTAVGDRIKAGCALSQSR